MQSRLTDSLIGTIFSELLCIQILHMVKKKFCTNEKAELYTFGSAVTLLGQQRIIVAKILQDPF